MVLDIEDIKLIVHDLNNPLGASLANLNFLSNVVEQNPMAGEAVQDCVLSQMSLRLMIDNLSVLAQLSEGFASTDRAEVASLVETALSEMRHHAGMASVSLEADVDPGLGWVRGEEHHLILAVENLIFACLGAAPAGSTIDLLVRSPKRSEVTFSVLDDGRQIPPEHRSLVNDRKGQIKLKAAGEGARSGRTLGLYIASSIAANAEGSLEVEEIDGRSALTLHLVRES